LEEVEGRLVTQFDGQGGGDHGEDARVIDEVGSTEVRRDAEVLNRMPNACGMGAAPWKRLRVIWRRDSTAKVEATAVRRRTGH
jgi:hypothetical protein